MTNQSPQQLAEQLARKCAFELCKAITVEQHQVTCDEWIAAFSHSKTQTIVLQSIPLVELLECVEHYKKVSLEYMDEQEEAAELLKKLDTKLTQILGEQKE